MTMTDAINAFLQQSINVEGLPFLMTQNSKDALREQAIAQLMLELKKGEDSVQSEADRVSKTH
jgi:antitoxin component of RelBE/YafQ-DinJ toxin-antitoxin module